VNAAPYTARHAAPAVTAAANPTADCRCGAENAVIWIVNGTPMALCHSCYLEADLACADIGRAETAACGGCSNPEAEAFYRIDEDDELRALCHLCIDEHDLTHAMHFIAWVRVRPAV
jgi:hypothetical protein